MTTFPADPDLGEALDDWEEIRTLLRPDLSDVFPLTGTEQRGGDTAVQTDAPPSPPVHHLRKADAAAPPNNSGARRHDSDDDAFAAPEEGCNAALKTPRGRSALNRSLNAAAASAVAGGGGDAASWTLVSPATPDALATGEAWTQVSASTSSRDDTDIATQTPSPPLGRCRRRSTKSIHVRASPAKPAAAAAQGRHTQTACDAHTSGHSPRASITACLRVASPLLVFAGVVAVLVALLASSSARQQGLRECQAGAACIARYHYGFGRLERVAREAAGTTALTYSYSAELLSDASSPHGPVSLPAVARSASLRLNALRDYRADPLLQDAMTELNDRLWLLSGRHAALRTSLEVLGHSQTAAAATLTAVADLAAASARDLPSPQLRDCTAAVRALAWCSDDDSRCLPEGPRLRAQLRQAREREALRQLRLVADALQKVLAATGV